MKDKYYSLINEPEGKIDIWPTAMIHWQQSECARLDIDPSAQLELIKASWWLWRVCRAADMQCDWRAIYQRLSDDNAPRLRRN